VSKEAGEVSEGSGVRREREACVMQQRHSCCSVRQWQARAKEAMHEAAKR